VPKSIRTPAKPAKSSPKPTSRVTDAAAATSAAAARAHSKRPQMRDDAHRQTPPVDRISHGENFAFIGVSIFLLVAVVCALLVVFGNR
jgi:hypothetical protein